MPRIDPERLLKCLQPLLEPTSGAIKSSEEVDKILGLMSKFSKKLVSKCIYINILKATHHNVLDLFMVRGGWSLVFGWANEAATSKNYSLLKEIVLLLLNTPTTLQRLRENKFPILIKSLSKDCEDEETRNLAKQVVAKWIIVAKGGESKAAEHPIAHSVQIPMQIANNINFPIDQNISVDQRSVQDLGNISGMNADSLLNIDPTIMPDAENQLMDFDISHNDLPDIDFNLDILSKVVDQQNLDDSLSSSSAVTIPVEDHKPGSIVNMELAQHNNTVPTVSSVVPIQPIKEEVIEMLQVQPAPKIFIKTVGGQRTVVQSLTSIPSNTPEGHYCVVIKDGRNYLMKLKTSESKPITSIVVPEPGVVHEKSLEIRNQAPDTTDSKEKRKQVKKEPLVSPNKAGSCGMKTYPPSARANNPIVQDGAAANKKNLDQNSKLGEKTDGKDKEKKHPKEKSGDGHKKSKSSSSSSKTAAAAALAKKQEDDEKLKEEIRKQKALMKKRQKEAVKQKQQEKDQETLKKLNLTPSTTTSSSGSMRIPKIPKKTASFADAIGIPGSDAAVASVDKIKKVSLDKSSSSKPEDNPTPLSPTKKFYGKEEPEPSDDKPKERRHKAKVFVNSKSKSEDLVKAMTESGKSKTIKDKEKEKVKEKEEVKANVGLGNSIPAVPPKVSKRLSTDTIEKPGESKKLKLSDSKSEKSKDKDTKESSPASKEKERKKAMAIALKESSLFMDVLNASSDVTKSSKRKRRPSIGSEKDKNEPESPVEKLSKKLSINEESEIPAVTPDVVQNAEEPVKPVFNFYRDTLNDSEEENKESETKSVESSSNSASEERPQDGEEGSFTPQDNDGRLKSALCLHRSKTKPKKSVRWRQEDELKEFHFFEMDETERVNVTKQKDFTEMSQFEKSVERNTMLRRKEIQEEEQRNEWTLFKIKFNDDVLQPPITSQEKFIQEEREKNVLGLFLPPGSILPETASEPDATIPIDRNDPRPIPVEDVIGITKVCDYRTKKWPVPGYPGYGSGQPEIEEMQPTHSMSAYQPTPTPDYNPWNASANLGFNVNVPPIGVPNMADLTAFQQFAPPINLIGTAPPPPIFPPNPFAFPPPMIPPPVVSGPPPGMDGFGVNHNNRDSRMGHPPSNRGGRFNEADQRRNFHGRDGGRERGGTRDRDYRDDRGGRDRERDRDYRRRDRDNNDRDYRHLDRDRNNRDFRPGSRNIRKDIPCRYYKKGFCQNGSRCEFSHDASNNLDDNRSNAQSRDTFDSGRSNRSPDSRDVDLRQEVDNSRDSWSNERQNSIEESNATSFALPPSSPTEPEPAFGTATESTKVIPV